MIFLLRNMRNHYLMVRHNRKCFLLCTCLLTIVFLYIIISLWNSSLSGTCHQLLPRNYLTEKVIPHNKKNGNLFLNSASTLPFLIDELMRINHSVHDELIDLHQRRKELVDANSILQNQVERLRSILVEHSRQIMRLRATLDSYKQAISENTASSTVFYSKWPIVQLKPNNQNMNFPTVIASSNKLCTIESCINWNRCRCTRFMKFCTDLSDSNSVTSFEELLQSSPHFTVSCNIDNCACLRLTFGIRGAEKCMQESTLTSINSPTCVVLFSNSLELDQIYQRYNYSANQFNFLLVANSFPENTFRNEFDFLLPINYDILCMYSKKACSNSSPLRLLPGRRSLLLSFKVGILSKNHVGKNYSSLTNFTIQHLKQMDTDSHEMNKSTSFISISIYESTDELENCWSDKYKEYLLQNFLSDSDWFPCEDTSSLRMSTFGLIMTDAKSSHMSFGLRIQLINCLANGAIPVFIGNGGIYTDEAIDSELLSKVIIRVPRPRVEELPVILQSLSEAHIVEIRRQGQILFKRFLKHKSSQLTTLLLAVSRRLGFPQPPAPQWVSLPAYGEFQPPKQYPIHKENNLQVDLDDFLGPIGPQQSSISYQSNYTGLGGSARLAIVSVHSDSNMANPFWLFPSTPWEPSLPSDAPFVPYGSTKHGLRPINHSINLAGYEFNMNLGGMYPYEQFTIVVLTYDRFNLLCQTLESFLNLPYLHSILVIWNNPVPPNPNLSWPQLHVPIKVILSQNNSLNNRFLPYDLIETDAVLSVDDDIQLRHDEIIFGFR
ncbi:Exostosin-3 [Schistosoma japonicum]|nr:Exostosin-3 [Schistosoma japonicum]KAH8852899.1 Exostosin-3 [Schistosoma japonicum]KAH8852901.1 Exostosin-3 [Schistosoma japonicum]